VESNMFAKQNLSAHWNEIKNRKRFAEIELKRALCKVNSRPVAKLGHSVMPGGLDRVRGGEDVHYWVQHGTDISLGVLVDWNRIRLILFCLEYR